MCLIVLIVLGIALPSQAQEKQPQSPDANDHFCAVVAGIRPSVVAIGAYDAQDIPSIRYFGTGFVVYDGQTVATNAHVVEALRRSEHLEHARVFFPDASPLDGRKATVWVEDSFHDVALLHFAGLPAVPLPLRDADPPQGRSVGVMGYPIGTALGLVPAVHLGMVAAVVPAVLPLPKGAKLSPELIEALRNPYNLYQLDLLVFPGHSGSPLFDARDGKVLGIINKTLATQTREHLLDHPSAIAYAVPVRWIQLLVKRGVAEDAAKTQGAAPQAQ